MADDKQTLDATTPEASETEVLDGGKESYSQDDLNALAGKVRAEEKAKAEKLIAQAKQEAEERIQKEKEEATRMATLSQEEKMREELKKEKEELRKGQESLTLERNKLTAERELSKLSLDPELVEIVLDADQDRMMEKIAKLEAQVKAGISVGVENALKGSAPKDFGGDSQKKSEKPKVITTF